MNILFQTILIRKILGKYLPILTSLYIWLKHILLNWTNFMYTKVNDIITHNLPSNWNMGVAKIFK